MECFLSIVLLFGTIFWWALKDGGGGNGSGDDLYPGADGGMYSSKTGDKFR